MLDAFASLFRGRVYNHRVPNNGDNAALELYEDLLQLQRSTLLGRRIADRSHVVNTAQRVYGKAKSRRGDGTFGERVPSEDATIVQGFQVARGKTATLEIGAECKIVSVAQRRQVDRVINDLTGQHAAFDAGNPNSIKVAFVGVNQAPVYRSIEGAKGPKKKWRITLTNGRGKTLHPSQEAGATIQRLKSEEIARQYNEFIILEYIATNQEPYEFAWVDETECRRIYSSALTRIAREYTRRFPD